jgi:hypothetical protein
MTIVTYRPKRQAKPAVEIKVPRIVQHTPKGKAWRLKPLEPDPEADERVADLMARMVRPRSSYPPRMRHPMTDDDDGPEPEGDLDGGSLTVMHGGIPQLLFGRHVARAIGRLITSATDVPAAALRDVAQRIRDHTDARHQVCMALAAAAAKRAKQNPDVVESAMRRWTPADTRKQDNREAIAARVLEDLADNPPEHDVGGPTDDFMNLFEDVAEKASSEELRDLFARVLAGELRKPSSFSLRTLQFLSVLDHQLAAAVQRASAWVTFGNIPFADAMREGEAYETLTQLQDAGVIRSGNHSSGTSLDKWDSPLLPFGNIGLRINGDRDAMLAFQALPLTLMGKEVMSLISPDRDDDMVRKIAIALATQNPMLRKLELVDIQKRTAETIWPVATPTAS